MLNNYQRMLYRDLEHICQSTFLYKKNIALSKRFSFINDRLDNDTSIRCSREKTSVETISDLMNGFNISVCNFLFVHDVGQYLNFNPPRQRWQTIWRVSIPQYTHRSFRQCAFISGIIKTQ